MGVNGSLTNTSHVSFSSKLPPNLGAPASPARSLAGACTAHALHDGLTDLIYVLLPVWQAQFALSYGALALLRGLYVGGLPLSKCRLVISLIFWMRAPSWCSGHC